MHNVLYDMRNHALHMSRSANVAQTSGSALNVKHGYRKRRGQTIGGGNLDITFKSSVKRAKADVVSLYHRHAA